MSKSKLFGNIKRALKRACLQNIANNFSKNPEDYFYSKQEISRRDFLTTLVAEASFISLSTCLKTTAQKSSSKSIPIIILGAGLAGLTTAYRLNHSGIACEIYEARERLGGRVQTKYNFNSEGMFCEFGGEFIDSNHTDILQLCHELNLEVEDIRTTNNSVYYFRNQFYSEKQLVESFRPLAQILQTDSNKIFGNQATTIPTFNRKYNASYFDKLSLAEYLYSQKNIDKWVLDLINVAYLTEYGSETDKQSALNLLLLIGTELSGEFPIYGESDEAFRVKGGNTKLVEALHNEIKNTVPIHCGQRLIQITEEPTRIKLLLSESTSKNKIIYGEKVICTLPFSVLRDIEGIDKLNIHPLKKRAIFEYGYGSNAKNILGFKNRFWRKTSENQQGLQIYTDNGSQSYWESSMFQNGECAVITNFIGGNLGKNIPFNTVENTLLKLQEIYPNKLLEYDNNKVLKYWDLDEYSKGSYISLKPGQYTTLWGISQQAELGGKLLFAGEHCSIQYSGYMNGAVQSANELLRFLL